MVKTLFLGLLAASICGFMYAAPAADPHNKFKPFRPDNSASTSSEDSSLEDPAARSERSTNLSHVTGTARKIQMFIKNRHLQILPEGTVNGTTDDTSAYYATWHTDGAKTPEAVGAGVVGLKQGINIPVSLSKDATVFQAEVTAIHHCVEEINQEGRTKRSTVIYTDSQAALKALNSVEIDSKLVWDCVSARNKLANHSKVTVAWVPGHEGYPGNEKADEMAKQGASTPFVGPEPF